MNRGKQSVVFGLALAAALASTVVACGGSVESPNTSSTASAATKAPVAQQTHGMVKAIGDSLGEVALRPDQRTAVETLAASAELRHAALLAGKKDVMLTFADQVEQGSIDHAALQAKTDALVATFEKSRPDDVAALTQLHDALDPEQRDALVDSLETKFKAKHEGHAGMGRLKQLAVDMGLSDDQKNQIKDVLEASREGKTMKAMHDGMGDRHKALEAFRGDSFDATAVAPSQDVIRARIATGGTKFLNVADKILPILTADQRKWGADKIRSLANNGVSLP